MPPQETPATKLRRKMLAARLAGVPLRRFNYGVQPSAVNTDGGRICTLDAPPAPGSRFVPVRLDLPGMEYQGVCALGACAIDEPARDEDHPDTCHNPHGAAARVLGAGSLFASGVLRGFDLAEDDADPRIYDAGFRLGWQLGALRRLLTPHRGRLGLTRYDYVPEKA